MVLGTSQIQIIMTQNTSSNINLVSFVVYTLMNMLFNPSTSCKRIGNVSNFPASDLSRLLLQCAGSNEFISVVQHCI